MDSILVSAPPPLRGILGRVLTLRLRKQKAIGLEAAQIAERLSKRVLEAGKGRKWVEPPFLAIVQHIDREELGYLSRGSQRFACSPEDSPDGWSSHPLRFRRSGDERSEEDLAEQTDRDRLASLAAYSVPIVFVGTFDLPSKDGVIGVKDSDQLFLDSSIWHRYVNLATSGGVNELLDRIENCQKWYREKRYSLTVAVEFLDYCVRALRHLYVIRGPEGGHGDFVTVHGFHSETEMANGAVSLAERKTAPWNASESCQVRSLLIDDFATKGLRVAYGGRGRESKGKLVRNALRAHSSRTKRGQVKFSVKSCKSFPEAEQVLCGKSKNLPHPFDLILLDFLLDSKAAGSTRWKGTDLLAKLSCDEHVAPGRTILGRYWILPVSSFPAVFEAEMRGGRTSNIERSYFLAPGADPVCTPQLFRFRIWSLLCAMAVHANLGDDAIVGPIDWAVKQAGRDGWVMGLFSLLSHRREAYEQIEADASNGSKLAEAFRKASDPLIPDLIDLVLQTLHYVLWGGSLTKLEALDRLELVETLVPRVDTRVRARLRVAWVKLRPHLEDAVIKSTWTR